MNGKRAIILAWLLLCTAIGLSVQRFPPPEFEGGYTIPTMTEPAARSHWFAALDMAVFIAALSVVSWLALKKRSRKGIVAVMLFSILYFGFWRKGCICPIGAIGNVTLGIFDSGYVIPWMAAAFFFLPIVFAIFFGRSFCAGVCPLGAIQDAVLLRPLRLPEWLETPLRLLAWLYLSLAVLYAATASAFIICRYDPFIAFFRFNANPTMWVVSISMLIIAVFVGRPYCRFLCPMGVILRQAARVSKYRVTITPDECIHCRLCEDACPFGAIRKPLAEWPPSEIEKGRRRLLVYLALLPVLTAAGALIGYAVHPKLALLDPVIELAGEVRDYQTGDRQRMGDEVEAFQSSGGSVEDLFEQEKLKLHQFAIGGALVGGWMGFVAAGSLIANSIFWRRGEYEAHRSGCVACGRCFNSCPRHHVKLKSGHAVKDEGQVIESSTVN